MKKSNRVTPKDIDEYIARFPSRVRALLQKMRATVRKAAPGAEEKISYQIPAFTLDGMLVFFAAHKKHLGFYPRATGIEKFKKELSPYKGAKGSVQFPLEKPIPFGLIGRIVKFRVTENLNRAKTARKR